MEKSPVRGQFSGMLHEDLEKSSALLFAVHKLILHIDGMTLQTLESLVVLFFYEAEILGRHPWLAFCVCGQW